MEVRTQAFGFEPLSIEEINREIVAVLAPPLREQGERLAEIMKREVLQTTYKGAPGHAEWRNNIANHIEVFPIRFEGNEMIQPVGYKLEQGGAQWMRALVVTFGSGYKSQTHGGIKTMIKTRPGEETWLKDFNGTHISEASSVWELPDEFNQEGNMWVENSMKEIQADLDALQARINSWEIARIIANHITMRRQ